MRIKLVDMEQFKLLKEGDILEKFPVKDIPELIVGNSREREIDIYEIRTVDHKKQRLSLIQSNKPQEMFTWPSDEERVRINYHDLITENTWWKSDCPDKEAGSTQVAKLYEH